MSTEVEFKEYFDSKFDGLEKLIDARLKPIDDHENRLQSLEKWRAYTGGALLVISFLIYYVCKML